MPYIATANPQKVSDDDEKGTARPDNPPCSFRLREVLQRLANIRNQPVPRQHLR